MRYAAKTLTLKIDTEAPAPEIMALAGAVIQAAGLVAFPTETVYGLGANALDEEAISHIFSAKGRPANDPIIAHIAELSQMIQLASTVPPIAYQLAEKFWPGPLTLILNKHPDVPDNLTAGQPTVAARMPRHAIAHALIEAAGVPVAAPSANSFSRPSPTTAQHVLDDLEGHVDVVLDGGSTHIGVESTIVDLTGDVPMVLRPGGISMEALQMVIPNVVFRPHYLDETAEAAPSPGTLLKHYSPAAQVIVFTGENPAKVIEAMQAEAEKRDAGNQQVGILTPDDEAAQFADTSAMVITLGADLESFANALFARLREIDKGGIDVILVRAPEKTGIGLAVWDRLVRAAAGQVIEVS